MLVGLVGLVALVKLVKPVGLMMLVGPELRCPSTGLEVWGGGGLDLGVGSGLDSSFSPGEPQHVES